MKLNKDDLNNIDSCLTSEIYKLKSKQGRDSKNIILNQLIHKRIIKLKLTRRKIINENRKNNTLLNFFLKLINN
jgi:hypothetical protein